MPGERTEQQGRAADETPEGRFQHATTVPDAGPVGQVPGPGARQ